MKKSLTVGSLLLAVLLVGGLAAVSGAEEGVTQTEIHIGQWGPQTGPAAAWGSVARGTDAFFKMINAEGGIHGRKLILHIFDDAYNPAKTKAGVKELQEGTGMFAWVGGVGAACGLSVKDYLMERGVPWVGPATGIEKWIDPPSKYLFAVYPLYYIEAKALCRYAADTLGAKKFAILYQNDDYGKSGVAGAKAELGQRGIELVAEVPVNVTDSDLKPHVMRLKQSGAEAVLLWTNPKHAVMTVGISKAMQFAPQFMSTSTCSDFPLMMHISKGTWEGVIAATFAELPGSDHPLLAKYKRDAYEAFAAKGERWGLFYYAGIAFAEPLVEAIRRAGPNLTRKAAVAQLEALDGYKGISGAISYAPFDPENPDCRQGQNQVFLVKCLAGGKAERLTPWTTID